MTLPSLIATGKFNYVNPNITAANFPVEPIRGKVKVFPYLGDVDSEYVIRDMQKDGYLPANLYELLEYAKDGWNGKDLIVALGSSWVGSDGSRDVPCLHGWSDERGLGLDWDGRGWDPSYRFLAVKKLDEQVSLSTAIGTGVHNNIGSHCSLRNCPEIHIACPLSSEHRIGKTCPAAMPLSSCQHLISYCPQCGEKLNQP